jgi:hypothetical protein
MLSCAVSFARRPARRFATATRVKLDTARHMHIRAVEDRAHQQIDQARLEAKALQQRLELERRGHDKRVTRLITQNEELQVAMRTAEQAAVYVDTMP